MGLKYLCVDRSLPAISRVVLISAREEDGVIPAQTQLVFEVVRDIQDKQKSQN